MRLVEGEVISNFVASTLTLSPLLNFGAMSHECLGIKQTQTGSGTPKISNPNPLRKDITQKVRFLKALAHKITKRTKRKKTVRVRNEAQ